MYLRSEGGLATLESVNPLTGGFTILANDRKHLQLINENKRLKL